METSYISELKNNNTYFFEEVYFKYNKALFNYFNKRIHSETICEDLIQDTFIRLWRYRARLDDKLSFEIQLFRIAKTTLIDVARRRSRSLEVYMSQDDLPETQNEDVHIYNNMEKREQLLYLFTSLPPVRRQILNLKIDGYSNKEIAQQLAITVKTVENNINLAYKELRKFSKFAPVLLLVLLSL